MFSFKLRMTECIKARILLHVYIDYKLSPKLLQERNENDSKILPAEKKICCTRHSKAKQIKVYGQLMGGF